MVVFILPIRSRFLMMNKETRKLTLVKEAWAEIEPYVLNCEPIIKNKKDKRKLVQLELDTADYVRTGIAVSVLNLESEAFTAFL